MASNGIRIDLAPACLRRVELLVLENVQRHVGNGLPPRLDVVPNGHWLGCPAAIRVTRKGHSDAMLRNTQPTIPWRTAVGDHMARW